MHSCPPWSVPATVCKTIRAPHKCAHTKSDDQVAGIKVRDDAFVEDDEHNQRSRKEANVEQLEHRNGVERIFMVVKE